jgi:hypothetical protein
VLRWIVELDCIDIMVEMSMLSSCLMEPREIYLEQCFHIFSYLNTHENSRLVFDPTYRNIYEARLNGKDVVVTCYCDADHAGCRVTRRSHTGILIFLNNEPVTWYLKLQNIVKSSTFGSKYFCQ